MKSDVNTFLQIIKDGSLSSAAKNLYISQSAISNRIKLLEEELGVKLIYRHRGQKSVEMTEAGYQFLKLAEQMQSIEKDIVSLKHNALHCTITIGSVDSVNNFTFTPFYKQLIEDREDLYLELRTHHSNEIHDLISNQTIDIGFVFSRISTQTVKAQPLYSERMVLIVNRNSDYSDFLDAAELDRKNEVFLKWNPEYVQWHNQFWDEYEKPYISVNTGSMIKSFLPNHRRAWSIVPHSVALSLQCEQDISILSMIQEPPFQNCYQITSKYPKVSRIERIKLISNMLYEYLKTCTWIETVYAQDSKETGEIRG